MSGYIYIDMLLAKALLTLDSTKRHIHRQGSPSNSATVSRPDPRHRILDTRSGRRCYSQAHSKRWRRRSRLHTIGSLKWEDLGGSGCWIPGGRNCRRCPRSNWTDSACKRRWTWYSCSKPWIYDSLQLVPNLRDNWNVECQLPAHLPKLQQEFCFLYRACSLGWNADFYRQFQKKYRRQLDRRQC